MTEEMEENGAWVPSTPAKSFPAPHGTIKRLNHGVDALENPHISSILRKLGHADKNRGNCGCGLGNFDCACQRRVQVAENRGGLLSNNGALDCAKRVEDYSRVVAAKSGFTVSGCAESGSESFEFPGTQENTDKGANPATTWKEGSQPHNHILHGELKSDTTEASSMQRNQTPKKRSKKGIDSDKQPRKRMRMTKHRPKVFDETKPKKASTPKPQIRRPPKSQTRPSYLKPRTPRPSTPKPRTPRHAKYEMKDAVNIPVDSWKDVSSCDRCKSSSRRKLDFSIESCITDQNSKACGAIENVPVIELKKDSLNIADDSLKDANCCDHDISSSRQELDFSLANCKMAQNSNARDGIENVPEVELVIDSLNIPVDSFKDAHGCDQDACSRRQKLDFFMEKCIVDQNSETCAGIVTIPEAELQADSLNISVDYSKDGSCHDHDESCSRKKLDLGMESCIMEQNSKVARDEIKNNKPEVESKLRSDNSGSCSKVYQRKFRKGNCIIDQNSKTCNVMENKSELDLKLHSDNRFSCLKVFQRKLTTGNCLMDQNPKAYDVIENKSEVEPGLHSDNGFSCFKVYRRVLRPNECLKNSRKLGPNCPHVCKRKRMRQQKATAFDKFIKLVGKISRAQRQRRMSKRLKSYPAEEDSKNFEKLRQPKNSLTVCVSTEKIPRNAVENPTIDRCTLNVTWIVNFKRKRSKTYTRRRNFSCFIKGVSAVVNFKRKRSKTSACRKDYSSIIKYISTLQVSVASHLKASNIRIRKKTIMLEGKEHSSELNNMRLHIEGTQREPETSLLSRAYYKEALADFACMLVESLHIDERCNQLMVRQSAQGALATSKGKGDPSRRRKQIPKVDLDSETMRVWNLLMENAWSEDSEPQDDDKKEYWREQREIFRGRVDSFIARMHLIQGDRRFSPWKGSVVDSVVGVFLTQNVSDFLSSSAFMNLAAKYPPSFVSMDNSCDDRSDFSITEIQHVEVAVQPSIKCDDVFIREKYMSCTSANEVGFGLEEVNEISFQTELTIGKQEENAGEKGENNINWDELRTKTTHGKSRNRMKHTLDSVNWEAVRQAPVGEVAKVIMERGMNNMLAKRIKDFLDRLVRDHGSIDLEWLRDVPPDQTKDYLLSITGLGLKSVECVRLLSLRHHAFPVDTNVGRILVRLGWVPLQPLPGDIQIHLLNDYPPLDTIQKYVWPRLCHLPKLILYELHYQMITFGKLFCTKKQPNCNACPMRGDCRHFASAFASGRFRLEGFRDKNKATESFGAPDHEPMEHTNQQMISANPQMISEFNDDIFEGAYQYHSSNCEPIVELPASPEPMERDIEDFGYDSSDEEIPTIKLSNEEFAKNVLSFTGEEGVSKALMNLNPETASIPMPKLKYVGRLRTVHHVYELPDSHILLAGYEKREPDDQCPYLLAIWTPDELTKFVQDSGQGCNNLGSKSSTTACCSGELVQYENDMYVRGTILIPCRTATRGSFPLNGTYFQVNEVFADHETSRHPIAIPREWIWNLRRRTLYCGTSATTICKGMLMEEILYTFRKGFICVRGFDRANRAPRPLARRLHLCKTRKIDDDL